MKKPDKTLGKPATSGRATWVQTERRAHEAWAKLSTANSRAAALMHHLVSQMGPQNAVVISQKTLAGLMGCSIETVKRSVRALVKDKWIQVVKINGPGTVAAYVVNSQVAFAERRENLHLAVFSANVVASAADQSRETLEPRDLRKIPVLFPGELQLPTGEGEEPPSEPALDGLEPDLPSITDTRQMDIFEA